MVPGNLTFDRAPPEWNSKGMFQLPDWAEPLIVLTILCSSMFFTRRKGFKIWGSSKGYRRMPLDEPDADSARSSDELLYYEAANENDAQDAIAASNRLPKKRRVCGWVLTTPNTSRFAHHWHSRLLQKFPFLIEMFYWIITYLFYRMTKAVSNAIFSPDKIWEVAQANGLRILEFEQSGPLHLLFPFREHAVQQWFMNGHQPALTFLNRAYALLHIPATVGFIAWYYYVAPNHSIFAIARRTLTLTNLLAFITFTLYPCMPPRLLPQEYGFLDTVRHDNAQSVWMKGQVVNSLAAMPSMHEGYAVVIACTLVYHCNIFRRNLIFGESRKSAFWKFWYISIALGYPLMVLTAIVATANHYWLDAVMACVVACIAFICNGVFLGLLPFEDLLLWALRLEKPIPSTGERFHSRGGRI